MEKCFENHYERTPAVMKELFRMIYFKRPVNLIIYVVLGGIAVANIITAVTSAQYSFTGCAYILIFLIMQLVMYNNSVKNAINRDRQKFGEDVLKVSTVVTDEGIRCTYGDKSAEPIPVSEIKKVMITKNLILLHTKARLLLIFDKNNFTVGTQEEFLKYLRENGLKA